jgi:hypothetical protein
MKKENINALDEINKGACMGMDAIDFIKDKIKDQKFKEDIDIQYKKYQNIVDKVNKLYPKYNDSDTPHKTGLLTKVMTWSDIEAKTFNDDTSSKIAELLLKGTNMGIIEGRKIINNKNICKEVKDLINEFVSMQEESVEVLKKYL